MPARSPYVATAVIAASIASLVPASAGVVRSEGPRLSVSPASAFVDERVDVRVTGLRRGQKVALVATARDRLGRGWRSRLVFAATRGGVVDTRSNMKLFWSMRPTKKSDADSLFALSRGEMPVLIRAQLEGRTVASGVLVRRLEAADLTATDTTLAAEGFIGTYYARPAASPRPAVLQLNGSSGGHSELPAAVLASHDYPTLALGYFNEAGLSRELRRFPLEYFRKALQWLSTQRGVDPRRLVVLGISYGGRAALLSGANFPDLVRGVVTCTGGARAGASIPDQTDAAWSIGGKPIAAASPIPVEQIAGTVLAFGAGKDAIGDSADAVRDLIARARAHGRDNVVGRIYPNAGHGVGCGIPNLPGADAIPTTAGTSVWTGGTPAANSAAAAAAWPLALRYFGKLGGSTSH
jgi:dienelactone hydrolase